MKIFKTIADFFTGRRKTAKNESVTTVSPTTSEERACLVKEMGEIQIPLFSPQPLMQWYGIFQAATTLQPTILDISQVQVLNLFHPLTSAFITTVFAIKNGSQIFWGKIGTRTIYVSEEDAFVYMRAQIFRICLKQTAQTRIMAICRYKRGRIVVSGLIREFNTPPVDSDREIIIECPLTPCSLKAAWQFAAEQL